RCRLSKEFSRSSRSNRIRCQSQNRSRTLFMHRPVNIERRQFRILYKAFLLRVIDLELLSADADTTRMLGQFAAMFAGLSYLFTFWVIFAGGRFSPDFLWVMEHFLIATTMLVVGLISVLCWE